MKRLIIVPHQMLINNWRHLSQVRQGKLLPFTIKGLVSHILKEKGIPYRENSLLEELAVWSAVWDSKEELSSFGVIADFPGFIADLQNLFTKLNLGEELLENISQNERNELKSLYDIYCYTLITWNVLDEGMQIRQALELWPNSKLNTEVVEIELWYLKQLRPLESKLLDMITRGKTVISNSKQTSNGGQAYVAKDLTEEIKFVATKLRESILQGVSPNKLAVAAPDLAVYWPVIQPIFEQYKIPWGQTGMSLANTPIGKGVISLYQGELNHWRKGDLRQLLAEGWGLPFGISDKQRRQLRLAAPVKGLIKWREQLQTTEWNLFLNKLTKISVAINKRQGLNGHIKLLQDILSMFPMESWQFDDSKSWSIYLQGYEGLQSICAALVECKQEVSFNLFVALLKNAMDKHYLKPVRNFQQQVSVIPMEMAVGMDFHHLYLIGMVDEVIPKNPFLDWLTRNVQESLDEDIYYKVLESNLNIYTSYPETDNSGQYNLASPLLTGSIDSIDDISAWKFSVKKSFTWQVSLREQKIQDYLTNLYRNRQLSVSRLNTYVNCPYKFFCQEILKLDVEEVASDEITPVEEGNLIHQVLKEFWSQKARVDIEEIAAQLFQETDTLLTSRTLRVLKNFAANDLKLTTEIGYQPYYLEYRFANLPISTNHGEVKLHGYIDRIDINQHGDYLIYDYKTGKRPSATQVLAGVELQLPVYLLAATKFLSGNFNGAAYYTISDAKRVGIWRLSAHKNIQVTKRQPCLDDEELNDLHDKYLATITQHLENIFAGEFPIKPREPHVCTYCPYDSICRREVAVNGIQPYS